MFAVFAFTLPAKCGCDTLKARLARELLPEGLENFRRQLQHGLACGEAAIILQGKGKESDDRQVQGCLTRFFMGQRLDSPANGRVQIAPKSRAEKNGHRFPTTAAEQSIYASITKLLTFDY